MLGDSAALGGGGGGGNGGDAVASAAAAAAGTHETASVGRAGSNSGDDERGRIIDEGERSFGGNRWPRQETLALLRIRSDMDVAFRDASVKGPLWEEVSRKMAELGYHRNAKKCKEKFENVYKYHKRTKDGRTGKSDGKTYRFFEQLEALENHPPTHHQSPSPLNSQRALMTGREGISNLSVTTSAQPISSVPTTTPAMAQVMPPVVVNTTVPSTTTTSIATTAPPSLPQGIVMTPSINIPILPSSYPQPTNPINFPPPPSSTANPTISFPNIPTDLLSNSSSSSTSSEETMDGRRKRKRKWKDFFERLMKEVIEKQEDLQRRFLEAIEKREHDRMAKEEAWRVQEMQRINREREILAQERSIAAAKDAAVMSFLQKIAEQQNLGQTLSNINIVQSQPPPPQHQQQQPQVQQVPQSNMALTPVVVPAPTPVSPAPTIVVPMAQVQHATPPPATQQQQQQVVVPQQQVTNMEIVPKADNGGESFTPASSSRWPKVEVQALIQLRTNLDAKYQENGPKGPLWEEISAAMKKLGYNRNAKRCKEKWENINKYFKKVKESNKKRPEDSKTCPYFHQLDALYREKNKTEAKAPDNMVPPLMVRPEQQWPPQQQENDPMDEDDEEEKEGEEDDEDEDETGSGDGGNNYEVLPSKPASAE